MPDRCLTCRFWDRQHSGHAYADCRRNPPVNTLYAHARPAGERYELTMSAHPAAAWPNTHQLDWCGQHQPHPKSPE